MASTTGIELGPDSCVLAGVRPARGGAADVVALHIIEPSSWPAQDVALTEMLRSVRRGQRFPRTARVVAWGLPDEPAINDPITRALLRPITAAGFRVASILTPPQALALLAASRPRSSGDGAVAWLALNVHAAAIAIVGSGELLFARTFAWSYNARPMSAKAQLLQRYSLVAQLAPEVHRGIAVVRASRGITVDGVVTCGDLPELRSLTMPLIEELDLEVETLDSTDGLRAVGKARVERFAESAPAIRLACAAALAKPPRGGSAVRSLVRVAAAIGILAALGWGGYAYWRAPVVRPATVEYAAPPNPAAASAVRRGASPQSAAAGPARTERAPGTPGANVAGKGQVIAQGPPVTPATPAQGRPPIPAAAGPPGAPRIEPKPQPAATAPAPPVSLAPPRPVGTATSMPPAKAESKPVPSAPPRIDPKPGPAAPTPGAPVAVAPPRPTGTATVTPPARPEPKPTPLPAAKVEPPPNRVEPPVTGSAPRSPVTAAVPREAASPPGMVEPPVSRRPNVRPVPLKEPLPKVESILIDQDRRLAIIDGAIVTIGDAVGPRVVVQIDRDAVVLREPSGLSIRIPVRSGGT